MCNTRFLRQSIEQDYHPCWPLNAAFGRCSRGTAIHRAATQVGDHRNRHTVTFSKGGNTTLRKRLAVGGGTAVGQRRNQREAATPLTAPMLARALAIATTTAAAATPVETLRSLHLCRSRDSATHRCGAPRASHCCSHLLDVPKTTWYADFAHW